MPRALWRPYGGGLFLMSEVPLAGVPLRASRDSALGIPSQPTVRAGTSVPRGYLACKKTPFPSTLQQVMHVGPYNIAHRSHWQVFRYVHLEMAVASVLKHPNVSPPTSNRK